MNHVYFLSFGLCVLSAAAEACLSEFDVYPRQSLPARLMVLQVLQPGGKTRLSVLE